MHIHGTADSTIPFAGDTLYPSIDSTIAYFVRRNACPATPTVTALPDIDTTDGCTVTKSYYGLCYDSIEVVLYTVINGGHTWPGSFPYPDLGNTNQDFNASAEIWKFLRKWRLNTNSVVIKIEEGRTRNTECVVFPNPSNGNFEVLITSDEHVKSMRFSIYNSLGQLVYAHVQKDHLGQEIKIAVDLSSRSNGIYLLKFSGETAEQSGVNYGSTMFFRKIIVQ